MLVLVQKLPNAMDLSKSVSKFIKKRTFFSSKIRGETYCSQLCWAFHTPRHRTELCQHKVWNSGRHSVLIALGHNCFKELNFCVTDLKNVFIALQSQMEPFMLEKHHKAHEWPIVYFFWRESHELLVLTHGACIVSTVLSAPPIENHHSLNWDKS